MFEAIKALIPNLFESARPRTAAKGHSSWLATAALLTRVATVHDEMSAGRREKLYALLKAALQLDDLTVVSIDRPVGRGRSECRRSLSFHPDA
jgi:uncharacterized tellurite resistance protein B-like protein